MNATLRYCSYTIPARFVTPRIGQSVGQSREGAHIGQHLSHPTVFAQAPRRTQIGNPDACDTQHCCSGHNPRFTWIVAHWRQISRSESSLRHPQSKFTQTTVCESYRTMSKVGLVAKSLYSMTSERSNRRKRIHTVCAGVQETGTHQERTCKLPVMTIEYRAW